MNRLGLLQAVCMAQLVLIIPVSYAEENKESRPAGLAWKDVTGKKYGPADITAKKATLFVFSSTECPISNIYVPRLIRLAKEFAPKGVQFFLVNSNTSESSQKLVKYSRDRNLPFPAIKDNGTELADKLQAH